MCRPRLASLEGMARPEHIKVTEETSNQQWQLAPHVLYVEILGDVLEVHNCNGIAQSSITRLVVGVI